MLRRFTETKINFKVWIEEDSIKYQKITGGVLEVREIDSIAFGIDKNKLYKLDKFKWQEVTSMSGNIKDVELIDKTIYVNSESGYAKTIDLPSNKVLSEHKFEYSSACLSLGSQVYTTKYVIKVANLKGEVLSRIENPANTQLYLIENNQYFIAFKYDNGIILWIHDKQQLKHIKFNEIKQV